MSETTIITEADVVAARRAVSADYAAGRQQSFWSALLASTGIAPEMVRAWLGTPHINWCACADPHGSELSAENGLLIVCDVCGLPPYWPEVEE